MLSKEEIENNKLSVSIPLITDEEIRQIVNNFDNVIEQFNKLIIYDKDLAMAQYIMKIQQAKIEHLESDKKIQEGIIEQLQKELGYKECILCGKKYKPYKRNQLYCSKSCCNKVQCKKYKIRKKQRGEE